MAETLSNSNTQLVPQKFKGLINENAKDWIRQFENYCQYKEFNADKKMALFKVLLVDSAAVWYDSLSDDNTDTWAHVKMAFETRYNPPEFMKYQHANDLFNKKQGDMSVDDFCAKMQRLANEVGADDLMLRFAVINGLNPEIRNHVTLAQPNTWTDLVKQAKVGEMCVPVVQPLDTTLAVKLEVIQDQLKQLTAEKAKPRSVSPVCSAECSDRRDSSRSNSRPGSPRRVRFDPSIDRGMQDYRNSNNNTQDQNWNADGFGRGRGSFQHQGPQNYSQTTNYGQISTYEPQNYGPQNFAQLTPYYGPQQVPHYGPQNVVQPSYTIPVSQPAYTPPPPNMETGRNAGLTMQCGKCGRAPHSHPNMCPAVNDNCHGCGLKGHFARVCRTTARLQQQQQSQ